MNDTVTRVIVRVYEPVGRDGDIEERDSFVVVEASEYREVDLIVHPFTSDARTFSLDVEQAWRLARELACAASATEREADGVKSDA